jgi:hypothetical protein
VTIYRRDRNAIYDGLMTDLTAIGDIFRHLHNDEPMLGLSCVYWVWVGATWLSSPAVAAMASSAVRVS